MKCRSAERELETLARLKNCLAFYKIIAWRIMYLTHLNRECPELPCNVLFEDCEWKSVCVVTQQELPKIPPRAEAGTWSEFGLHRLPAEK